MTEGLTAANPETAFVEEHGVAWVVDNYYARPPSLGVVMTVPETEGLPLFDADTHETMNQAERVTYEVWAQYRENRPTGSTVNRV